MKRIILDTNFLMIPFQFKIDIFSEFERVCLFNYKLYVFEETIGELKNIAEKQRKHKKAAKFALKLIKLKNIDIIKSDNSQRSVDLIILNKLGQNDAAATQDVQLKNELLKKGVSVIILRQKKYLEFIERKLYK